LPWSDISDTHAREKGGNVEKRKAPHEGRDVTLYTHGNPKP